MGIRVGRPVLDNREALERHTYIYTYIYRHVRTFYTHKLCTHTHIYVILFNKTFNEKL